MRDLYLECSAGISGDMLVAALLDLGADREALDKALQSIPAQGFSYAISRVKKAGVECCDFDVILDAEHENHDHDMAYLHGSSEHVHTHSHEGIGVHEHEHEHEHHHEHEHSHEHEHHQEHEHEHSHEHCHEHEHHHEHEHEHSHEHEHHHEHEHEHSHEHCHEHEHHHEHEHEHEHIPHEHHHHHEHRGLKEVIEIINAVAMTANARSIALRIFDVIAEAEAKAHAVPKEEVHFHEVGAIDSIVDIVAIAVCMDSLQVNDVIVPLLREGSGNIRCQHGILPVPVPAVANILAAYDIAVQQLPVEGEFVTPTGAAAVAALRTLDRLPSVYKIKRTGLGAGKREYAIPSILRAMLIETAAASDNLETVMQLVTNIDDSTGETMGYVLERLMEAGALDAAYLPIFMKKNRPAYQLQVLCAEADTEKLEQIIYSETSTIGIRHELVTRSVLKRHEEVVNTMYGPIKVKVCELPEGERYYVEYASAAAAAKANAVPLVEVYREVDANFT